MAVEEQPRTVMIMTTPKPNPDPNVADHSASSTSSAFDLDATQRVAAERGLRHPIAPRFWRARNLGLAAFVRVLMSFLGMVVASAVVVVAVRRLYVAKRRVVGKTGL